MERRRIGNELGVTAINLRGIVESIPYKIRRFARPPAPHPRPPPPSKKYINYNRMRNGVLFSIYFIHKLFKNCYLWHYIQLKTKHYFNSTGIRDREKCWHHCRLPSTSVFSGIFFDFLVYLWCDSIIHINKLLISNSLGKFFFQIL